MTQDRKQEVQSRWNDPEDSQPDPWQGRETGRGQQKYQNSLVALSFFRVTEKMMSRVCRQHCCYGHLFGDLKKSERQVTLYFYVFRCCKSYDKVKCSIKVVLRTVLHLKLTCADCSLLKQTKYCDVLTNLLSWLKNLVAISSQILASCKVHQDTLFREKHKSDIRRRKRELQCITSTTEVSNH